MLAELLDRINESHQSVLRDRPGAKLVHRVRNGFAEFRIESGRTSGPRFLSRWCRSVMNAWEAARKRLWCRKHRRIED